MLELSAKIGQLQAREQELITMLKLKVTSVIFSLHAKVSEQNSNAIT